MLELRYSPIDISNAVETGTGVGLANYEECLCA